MQFLKNRRLREVKTLKFILREAKKEGKLLRENKTAQREYFVEAQRAINAYYAYALLERELRLLSEATSLVASEDATITFLLKNLAHSESNNEIGHYINDQFSDLISAVETLNKNVSDQETGTVGKPAKFGGYGGGIPMGTAGIMKELFGSPPGSSARAIPRSVASTGKASPPPVPAAAKKPSNTLGNYMSGHEKGLEKQQNIAGSNEKAMQTLETKLPKAAEFLQAVISFFTNQATLQKVQSGKKGFFGGDSKVSAIKSAFGKFPGFNVALFAKDLEEPGVIQSIAQTAKLMQPDVAQLEPIQNLVKGKLGQSIKNKLSGFFGGKPSPAV